MIYAGANLQGNPLDKRLIDGVGLWCERLTSVQANGGPVLFLDRDGVIVEEVGYLARSEDVKIVDEAAVAIRLANELSICVVVVTNQSGIGRGLFGWDDFERVQHRISELLALKGAHLDLVVACAYHQDGIGEFCKVDHPWRKPNNGMLIAGANCLRANLSRSLMVGDKVTDLEAARASGVGKGILVRTGYGAAEALVLETVRLAPMKVSICNDASAIELWLEEIS